MSDCIFCKIVKGEFPSSKVYEDDRMLAILDIHPLAPGHTLVMPKIHYPTLSEMPGAEAAAVSRVFPMLGQSILAATGCVGYNLFQSNGAVAGQEVMHVHFHLVPRRTGDGLGYRWKTGSYAGEEIRGWQEKIAVHLKKYL